MPKHAAILSLCILCIFLLSNNIILGLSDFDYSHTASFDAASEKQNGIKVRYSDNILKTRIGGRDCIALSDSSGDNFINFDVDDTFIFNKNFNEVILKIEYFDIGNDTFAIQYDSAYAQPYNGAFMRAGKIVKKEDSKTWKTYTTVIKNVRFANRQGRGPAASALLRGGGGDFRINARGDGKEYIRYVEITIPYITVQVNSSGNIFAADEDIVIAFNVNNRKEKDVSYNLLYKVRDVNDTVIMEGTQNLKVSKRAISKCQLKMNIDKKGVFFLDLELYDGKALIDTYKTSFAYTDRAVKINGKDTPFGVADPLLGAETDKAMKVMDRLNIGWVRFDIRPIYDESGNNEFDWNETDIIVKESRKNNINLCGVLLGDGTFNPTTGAEKDIRDYSGFVSEAALKYRGKIRYWEVWNEPDLRSFWQGAPSPENYTKLLKACYSNIKRADASNKVMIGGLAGSAKKRFWFLSGALDSGAAAYFDIAAIHLYADREAPEKDNVLENMIRDALGRMDTVTQKKKIWITEMGWSTSEGPDKRQVTPIEQAIFLVRSYIIALSEADTERIFWHSFKNIGSDGSSYQQNFGLLNDDFTPKPAAVAYLNMANRLAGLAYIKKMDLEDPARGYVFGDRNKKVMALWSIDGRKELFIPVDKKSFLFSDLMGNTLRMESQNNILRLMLTESPIYLEEKR